MKVLVTGATGFLGSHLIPTLLERGHEVRGLVTPDAVSAELRRSGVAVYAGDVRRPDGLAAPLHGVDAVIHLAAAIGTRRPMADYAAVNVGGTENICRAALRAGVGKVVHLSTTSVYAQGLGRPVAEDTPLDPLPDPYAVTKAAGDLLVQRLAREDGLPACVLRTTTFFGPGDHLNFGRIAARLLAGRAIIVGAGRNRVPFTYVGDIVRGIVSALESDRSAGNVYNLADGDSPTQEQLLAEIAGQLGVPGPTVHVPYRLLYATGWAGEGVARLSRRPNAPLTRFGVALYGADNRYSIEKARRELGYEPRVSLREGVRMAADWYLGVNRQGRSAAPALVAR